MIKNNSFLYQIWYLGNNKNFIYYLNFCVFTFIDYDNKIANSIYKKINNINRKIKIINIFYDKNIDETVQLIDVSIERIF